MEILRESNIFFDNGGPFIVWDEESSHEHKRGAVIDTLICSNPSCRGVHISAMHIDERFKDLITIEDGKSSYQFTDDRREQLLGPLKRASFSVDIDSHEIEPSIETSGIMNDPELFAWLSRKIVSEEYLELLMRRWRIQKEQNDDQWRKEDWSWWQPGEKIPFYKAFPDSFSFFVPYNNHEFLVADYYCVTPGCQCQGITLSILDFEKKPIEAGGSIDIDSRTLKPISFDSISIDRNILQNIWKEFRRTHDLKSSLQERRKKNEVNWQGTF